MLFSLARNSQEPTLRRFFENLWVLFEKIWWALGQVRDIFCKCHLHNASKEVFWPKKKNWIPCMGSKGPIWQFFNSGKMVLLNSCMKFECPRVCQTQDLGQWEKKIEIFSKRTHKISKILFNLGSCEFSARLESKTRKCLFFDGSLL